LVQKDHKADGRYM